MAVVLASFLKFYSGIFPGFSPLSRSVILAGAVASVLYWWLIFSLAGCYRPHWDRSWTDELAMVFKPVTTGMVVLGIIAFLIDPEPSLGRWIIIIYYSLLLLLVFISRAIGRTFERKLSKRGKLYRKALIVGVGDPAKDLTDYLESNPALGYKLVGYIDPPHPQPRAVPEEMILGDVNELQKVIEKNRVRELLVTIASNFHQDILSLLLAAAGARVRVKVVPDLFDVLAGHVHNTQILGQPLMEVLPEKLSFWQRSVKTFFDYGLSILVVGITLPLWIIIAVAIKINSKGPVFYRQERVGKGGHTFRIFKFRSMVRDAESKSGPVWAGKDDPRITWVGKIFRKTRLDELPQFLNVLRGEMSVVGPRPERPAFVEELREVYPFYSKRLTIKPGITGWAQVKLEYDTSVEDVAEKLKFDFYYLENQSLFLDLEILVRTLVVVITGAGAH
ncbi:exopolysaccharide biosynthesis polyprenyl glycosylphosphotransferase [Candidatus Fermentibacteria bacterium]|nr:exopolysaccharide biosynthesis polyprenyl glycosylphosphotransferase [Candidatus Fermentibacteria bacterium]